MEARELFGEAFDPRSARGEVCRRMARRTRRGQLRRKPAMMALKPPGEAPVDTLTGTSTAGQGVRPGGTAAVQRTMTATIDAIDKNASSITFVGPNGWKYSRHIVDPEVLDKVKVGDKVDITWNTDVTVLVQ